MSDQKMCILNQFFRKSEKLEEFKVTVPKSLVLFTMKRLMAKFNEPIESKNYKNCFIFN